MKTAKLGAIFMASVMALTFVGAGYSHWFDHIDISITADMGRFGVGFVEQWTDDPYSEWNRLNEDTMYDPDITFDSYFGLYPDDCNLDPDQPEDADGDGIRDLRVCGAELGPHLKRPKDYAYIECELIEDSHKMWHNQIDYMYHCFEDAAGDEICEPVYEIIEVTLGNVYPNYAPNLWFRVANAGTVAADIVGHWIIEGPPNVNPDDEDSWIEMDKCTMYPFDLNGDGDDDVEIGFFMDPDYVPPKPEQPQQIDPCHSIWFGLSFHILQPYPQCTETTFKFKLRALNYNHEICDFDDPDGTVIM
jgi:hypothetical protein